MEHASCQHFDAYNCDVAPRFWGSLCTPGLDKMSVHFHQTMWCHIAEDSNQVHTDFLIML